MLRVPKVVLVLLVLSTTACRTLHEASVRRRLPQTLLAQAEFPLSQAQADALFATHRAPGCAMCLTSVRVGPAGTTSCFQLADATGCVTSQERPPGRLRFERVELSGVLARELLGILDPATASAAALGADVPALAAEEEQAFAPRWSFFGGAVSNVLMPTGLRQVRRRTRDDAVMFSFGAHAGVRRWLGYFLIGGAGLEYEAPPLSTLGRPPGFHVLGLQARAEVSMWVDEGARRFNLPERALVMTVTPVVAFGSGSALGVRAALGLHLTHVGDAWVPVFFDVGYQSLTVGDVLASGVRLSLGLGL